MKWLLVPTCTLALCCASVQASRLSEYMASPALQAKLQEVYGGRALQRAEAFSRLLTPRAGTTDQQKIELVNNYFNNLTYREDPKLWGMEDYWANPLEFIGARGGDCEDYSITKYYALRQLGVPIEQMRIVMLVDSIRGIAHAVLAVTQGEQIYVLDNVSDLVLPHTKYEHYVPQYSVNEHFRWAHVSPAVVRQGLIPSR